MAATTTGLLCKPLLNPFDPSPPSNRLQSFPYETSAAPTALRSRQPPSAHHAAHPLLRVCTFQCQPRSVPGCIQEFLDGHQPLPESQPDAGAQTRPVRAGKEPRARTPQRMCPQRLLATVQRNAADANRQFRAFPVRDLVRGRQRVPQDSDVDPLLPRPLLARISHQGP